MARHTPPNYVEKRRILFSETVTPEEIDEAVQMLIDDERLSEALDLLEKAGNEEKIRAVCKNARELADASVWLRAHRLLGETPTPEMWEGLAEHALDLGKEHFARWAFDQAGMKDRAEAIRMQIEQRKMARRKEDEKEEA